MNHVNQTIVRNPAEIESINAQIKHFLETSGIYIFITSFVIFTQLKWIKEHNKYGQLEVRLVLGLFAGLFLSFIIVRFVETIMSRNNKKSESFIVRYIEKMMSRFDMEYELFIREVSLALSPGILFVLGTITRKFLLLGVVLCVLTALYLWVRSFRDFADSMIFIDKFKATLMIKDGKAAVSMQGTYESNNPKALQSFLSDLSIDFYECAQMKVDEIKIDFSGLKERDEDELKPIMESMAGYFNLKVSY